MRTKSKGHAVSKGNVKVIQEGADILAGCKIDACFCEEPPRPDNMTIAEFANGILDVSLRSKVHGWTAYQRRVLALKFSRWSNQLKDSAEIMELRVERGN